MIGGQKSRWVRSGRPAARHAPGMPFAFFRAIRASTRQAGVKEYIWTASCSDSSDEILLPQGRHQNGGVRGVHTKLVVIVLSEASRCLGDTL